MKALRWHATGDVRLDEVPLPGPLQPGQALLRVLACGLCGTDVEEWRSGPVFIPVGEPHRLTGQQAPLTLGHEVAGVVVDVVDDGRLRPGDLVAVDGLSGCGACAWCRGGRPMLCDQLAAIGLMSDGGLAEYCVVPAAGCFVLPPTTDPAVGALTETLAVGVRALTRGRLAAGDDVVVVGAGAVGLLAAQAARAKGAGSVTVVDPQPARRAAAERLGLAAHDPGTGDVEGDLVVECSGAAPAVGAAIRAARKGGRTVLVGITSGEVGVDALDVVVGEKEILGSLSHHYASDFAAAVDLIASGAIDPAAVVSHRIPLAQALDAGLRALAERPGVHLKIVVEPEHHP